MALGLNTGHTVTKNKPRHNRRHRRLTTHSKFVRDMIREVCGFAPYERRAMELLKVSKDKRALSSSRKGWGHTSARRGKERSWASSWPPWGKREPRTEPFPSVHNESSQKFGEKIIIIKFAYKNKGSKIAKTILKKKNKAWGTLSLNFFFLSALGLHCCSQQWAVQIFSSSSEQRLLSNWNVQASHWQRSLVGYST